MTVKLYGVAPSSYVRTARWACEEKGVPHELLPPPEAAKPHPYGKIPFLEHGGTWLYETTAICRYIDTAFDGPRLLPEAPLAQARVEQYVSFLSSYWYPRLISDYAMLYVLPMLEGKAPDAAAIDRVLPQVDTTLGEIEAHVGDSGYLVGDSLTLADLFLAPVVATVDWFEDGKALLGKRSGLKRHLAACEQRDGYGKVTHKPF